MNPLACTTLGCKTKYSFVDGIVCNILVVIQENSYLKSTQETCFLIHLQSFFIQLQRKIKNRGHSQKVGSEQ